MAHVKNVEVEPPMHLQRPSSSRSQDVSHLLASVFREVFTRDVIREDTVRHLAVSKSGDADYHDKYVEQLRKIQEERDRRHREADMLEAHIMQAQAAAMAADERELQRVSEGYENYHTLGLPPARSNLRYCIDTELLRRYNLIVPADFVSEDPPPNRAPQADAVPSYARPTTSSQHRFRKTPPLTDYAEDNDAISPSIWPWISLPPTQLLEKGNMDMSPPPSAHTKFSKVSSWKESMKPEQRQVERDDLKRLQKKAEYKRNPRFVPPLNAGLIKPRKEKMKTKVKTEKKEKWSDPVEVFIASPSPVIFTVYEVGKVYEITFELKNVSSSSRQLRITPPSSKYFSVGLGRFPGEHGVVAPGLSCQYPIRFAPDSLADYDDFIKVKTQVDPPMIISIQARRPPPVLSLSPVLDCGHALVGGTKLVQVSCENTGGGGRFCIMRKSSWPTTEFKCSLDNPGSVVAEPFVLKPAMFELSAGKGTTLEITFSPTSAKYFKEEIVFVCDNCHVKEFSLEELTVSQSTSFNPVNQNFGTGQIVGIELESVTGGFSEPEISEIRDVSAQYLIRFDQLNPETTTEKTLVVRNTTNVSLPFCWKLFKPYFKCPVPPGATDQSPVTSSQVQRTLNDDSVFQISPNMGLLPPNQSVDFILEFAPREVGRFHSVGHLILEEIPVHDDRLSSSREVRVVTAVEIELKASSKPFNVGVSPSVVTCPGTLTIGVEYRFPFKMFNSSVSDAQVTWENIVEPSRRLTVEPPSCVIGIGKDVDCELVVFTDEPGLIEETMVCQLKHSSAPVYLCFKASFAGPEVVFTSLDVDFNLIRLGESCCREIAIKNVSSVSAQWRIDECIECCVQRILQHKYDDNYISEFTFYPDRGVLAPQESQVVSVIFTPVETRRVRTVFQCEVDNGITSYLSVFSEVQSPQACLLSCDLYIEKVFLGVPVSREILLQNQTLLYTEFRCREVVGGDYTLKFEPDRGVLEPREVLSIKLTFIGHKKGPVSRLVTFCDVYGMSRPVCLSISADVQGLSVTFATPKLFDLGRPDELKEESLEDRELLLDFETVPLNSCPRTTLVLTNTSAIKARFNLELDHFKATKPPTPPDGNPQGKRSRLLGRTANIADPLSKTAVKAHADYSQAILRDRKGAAFEPNPATGELLPFGYQLIEITGYNDMWGDYRDLLICKIEGIDPVYIPIKMNVVGCPLNLQMMKDQAPIVRFGSHVSGAPLVQRSLRINNTSPYGQLMYGLLHYQGGIRLDWETYNIDPDDDQFLDLLVFVGDSLPVFSNGQEVEPVVQEDDYYQEEKPLIQVRLREHEGVRANRPFDVTPYQQVIPAKGHGIIKVSFHPYTDSPSGQLCSAYAAAFMSLECENLKVPGRVDRVDGMETEPFRLNMTANIDPALLSVEMEEDKGSAFIMAASDLLRGETSCVHRFVLSNTTETPLTMMFTVDTPFQIVSSEPPSSAKATRPQTSGRVTIKPTKTIEIKVGFWLSEELIRKVNDKTPNEEQDDGVVLRIPSDGDRKLLFRRDLKVLFSNGTSQLIPLTACVAVPTLRLSHDILDFGTCLVGQSIEMHVTLKNPSQSASVWMAKKDPRCPSVSQDVFAVSPIEGFLEACTTLVSETKALLKITFTAKHNVEYECTLLVSGQLQEEEQRLVIRGRGSYDQKHERLVNVITST